jgi:hypothetical protein
MNSYSSTAKIKKNKSNRWNKRMNNSKYKAFSVRKNCSLLATVERNWKKKQKRRINNWNCQLKNLYQYRGSMKQEFGKLSKKQLKTKNNFNKKSKVKFNCKLRIKANIKMKWNLRKDKYNHWKKSDSSLRMRLMD